MHYFFPKKPNNSHRNIQLIFLKNSLKNKNIKLIMQLFYELQVEARFLCFLVCNKINAMKRLIVIACLSAGIFATSCHSNSNGKKEAVAMPESVLTSFHQKYPNAKDVDWKQE